MADLIFVGQFVASKAGKTGLTVTVDVDRYTISDGSRSSLVTAGSATEGRRGLYHYRLVDADLSLYQYVATFITADATVDQQQIAALGLVVPDVLIGSRATQASVDDVPTIEEIAEVATGLTAQQVADAVNNLAPVGTPAAGSIGDHLDDLAAALAAATATLTVVSAVDGGEINIYQAVTLAVTISGLAIPAEWTKVYWTVKRATSEADTDAILQMVETNPSAGTDGLLRVNGAAGTAGNGSLTVDQAAGTVVIDMLMTICDDLALATGLVWSLKALHPTSAATLLATGTVNVLGQATAAVA